MSHNKKWLVVANLLAVASLILSACATPTPTATQPPAVQPTKPPAAAPTQPPPPPPTEAPKGLTSKDPTTFNYWVFGDPETLDPAIDYETAGSTVLLNIYENLVTFDGVDPVKVKPELAEAIPDPVPTEDGGVTYTWTIVDGVKFHNGDPMTAEDVAFSFWRAMLVGDPNTPAFLMLEPFFGIDDPSQIVLAPDGSLAGDPDSIKASDAKKLEETCEKVKAAVTFDTGARTVTTKLVKPWGPFLVTLAGGGWASVMDKKWVAENGDWDGDCKTWQNFYGIPSESGVLRDKTNGTGPFMLDHWTPEDEVVMVSNPDYREGEAKIKRVVIKNVTEFGTRFAALQAGDADTIVLGSQADWAQMDTLVAEECDINTGECQPAEPANPNGILRRYKKVPRVLRTDVFFNFNVAEGSNFIGSGKLDGQGISPDFFSDIHIRKAFNYCFDWGTYVKDVFLGEGEQSAALTLPGQPGYEGTPTYSYDLAKCEEEFKASTWTAEDGTSLWDTGFYLQAGYNVGNTARQSVAEILSAGLQQVNPNFFVTPVALPWPVFLRTQRAKQLPLFISGWQEDIHDPHNWYVPYLPGTYGIRQSLPAELLDKYKPLIDQGVYETDQAKRAQIYSELNNMIHEDAPHIILAFGLTRRYEPLYLHGWYGNKTSNPMIWGQGPYFYDFSKD